MKLKLKHKRWWLYMLRWQMSTVILAPVMSLFSDTPICWTGAIVANLIGGEIFYFVDKYLFNKID